VVAPFWAPVSTLKRLDPNENGRKFELRRLETVFVIFLAGPDSRSFSRFNTNVPRSRYVAELHELVLGYIRLPMKTVGRLANRSLLLSTV
jgi:hypothetical protein